MTTTADETTVWTIGHAHHPMDLYLQLLSQHDIATVVDIRSRPYIRYAHQFDRENLQESLAGAGLVYIDLGEQLGQRPEDTRFYDDEGHTLYAELAKQPWFAEAIERVEAMARGGRTALSCLEEEPERCHRYHLIGRVLVDRGVGVSHIRREGATESQQQVAERLGEGQESLFGGQSAVWRSPMPMQGGHGQPEPDG